MTQRVSNQRSLSIAPLSSTLLSIQLPKRQSPGNLVTVALEFLESGSVSVGTGVRLAKTHFPIESWPKSDECPFPTINDDNYKVNIIIFSSSVVVLLNLIDRAIRDREAHIITKHYRIFCKGQHDNH